MLFWIETTAGFTACGDGCETSEPVGGMGSPDMAEETCRPARRPQSADGFKSPKERARGSEDDANPHSPERSTEKPRVDTWIVQPDVSRLSATSSTRPGGTVAQLRNEKHQHLENLIVVVQRDVSVERRRRTALAQECLNAIDIRDVSPEKRAADKDAQMLAKSLLKQVQDLDLAERSAELAMRALQLAQGEAKRASEVAQMAQDELNHVKKVKWLERSLVEREERLQSRIQSVQEREAGVKGQEQLTRDLERHRAKRIELERHLMESEAAVALRDSKICEQYLKLAGQAVNINEMKSDPD
eukprot:gene21445-25791_t